MMLRAVLALGLLLPAPPAWADRELVDPDRGAVITIVPSTSPTMPSTTTTSTMPPTTTSTFTTTTSTMPPTTTTTFTTTTSTVPSTTTTTFTTTTSTVPPTSTSTVPPTSTSTYPSTSSTSTTITSSTSTTTSSSTTTTTIPDCTCSDATPVLGECPGPICGPMDVVFVVDDTGSMGGALCNVKAAIAALIDQIACASGDNFQLGLLTFKDQVVVLDDLAADNRDSVEAHVRQLFASGGNNAPEASDEALNTAISGLDEADRGPGQQIGDFDGVWRDKSVKIIVLITDAPPAGFDDQFTPGVDDVNAHARAVEAAAANIKLSAVFVPTSGNYSGQVAIMQDYAATTGGLYLETAPDGAGTAAAIDQIILSCGGSCGDGVLDPGESCDDGNPQDGDGCDIYCRQSFTCPVLPPDSCLASLETCTMPDEPALTVPVCTSEVIGTGDGCDCGCGFPDPDCEGGGCTERGCTAPDCVSCTDACGRWTPCPSEPSCPAPPAEVPDKTPPNSPPPEWICSPSWWGSGDVCDCFCGSPDPDCGSTDTSGGVVCEPFCGDGHCDTEEFPSTCPEDCAPPPPFTAYPATCGL